MNATIIDKESLKSEKAKSSMQALARMMLDGLEQMKDELREEVASETRAELETEYQHRLEEELASLGVHFRNGEISGFDGQNEGIFELNDMFFAREAQMALQRSWMPLIVRPGKDGSVTNESVKEALTVFLMGAPLGQDIVAGDTTTSMVLRVMEASEQRWKTDPNARSAMRSLSSYTLGNGITLQAANEEIQDALKSYWKINMMSERMADAIPRRILLGEHYFQHLVSRTGQVYTMDRTKPYEITKVATHPDDHIRTLAFGRTKADQASRSLNDEDLEWFPDIDYYEQLDSPVGVRLTGRGGKLAGIKSKYFNRNNRMQMCRLNSMGSIRGLTDMYSVLRWYKYYEDFVTDRVILNHERSKIVWVRTIKGSRAIPGGRAQRGPKGGQVLTETDQVQWKALNAEIHASDVMEDGRLIRLMISAGLGIPEHILFQDPSNQVYASIRSSDTPFSQNIMMIQSAWKADLQATFQFIIREGVSHKLIPAKVPVEIFRAESIDKIRDEIYPMIREGATDTQLGKALKALAKEADKATIKVPAEDVKIRIDFPNVVQVDPLKKAQISEVLKRATIASSTSLAAEHGYDWGEEVHEISIERDEMVKMGLTDSKIIPFEKARAPEKGKNDTKSPTTRNEPGEPDTSPDELDDTDAS